MKRASALALLVMTAAISAESPAVPEGLWIYHGEWEYAPKEINEDGDIHKVANAAIINLCPNGGFRLATGVIYQSTKSPGVQIGVSDGLAIYSGSWSRSSGGIRVEYRLVSAEFRNTLDDAVAAAKRAAVLVPGDGKLTFPFTSISGKIYPLTFTPAASYEKEVGDEFVECARKREPPPVPPRRRTGGDRGDGTS